MATSDNNPGNERIPAPRRTTGALPLPSPRDPDPMHTTLPVTMPVAAPFEPRSRNLSAPYPVVSRATFEMATPVAGAGPSGAQPAVGQGPPPAHPAWTAPAAPAGAGWAEPTQLVGRRQRPPRAPQQFVGTIKMRHSDLRIVVGKLVLPIVLLVIAGVAIGGYVVFSGTGKPGRAVVSTPAATPALAPAPAPPASVARPAAEPAVVEPAVAEPAAVPPAPVAAATPTPSGVAPSAVDPADAVAPAPPAGVLVDVRIDSTPSGAAVTLVDRGKSQFVGNTPVNATVDGSLEYDLVFAYPHKPTQIEHLDARTTRHVAVTLGARAGGARVGSTPPRAEKPGVVAAPAAPAQKPARAAAPAGDGTLMISSKPPCEIVIDGKPTGLTTPQRAITLAAGTHKITLVSSDKAVQRTVSVQITANTTEKVIEDLMQ